MTMLVLAQSQGLVRDFEARFSGFLPDLLGGLTIVVIGVVVGWLAKRAVMAFLRWIRLDRLGGPVSWRTALGKADVRDAVYGALGSVAMVLVVLLFLEQAFQKWGLVVLTQALEGFIRYFPNLALVGVIVGVGLLVANLAADRVEGVLDDAGVPNAPLLGGMAKAALLAVVAALALWELEFARQIVMGAFLIGFGAIGVAFALAVGVGSSQAIKEIWTQLFEERKARRKE
jgi:hypothetical protein